MKRRPRRMFFTRQCPPAAAVVFLALLTALPAAGQRATTSDQPLSERRVSYDIDVSLDPDARTVSGSQTLTWRNPGDTPVSELQFHLYLNAFRPGSTFQRESGGRHRGFSDGGSVSEGSVEVTGLRAGPPQGDLLAYLGSPADLTAAMRFIQPDDGNPQDRTVMAVTLPEPVAPGATIQLDMEFVSTLPRVVARTGWADDGNRDRFFMVAQWFPKIAVYEVPGQRYVPEDAETGRWNAHQFHANSEFYADFGVYDVTMRVPADYVVGASGVRTSESTADSIKTLTYRAEDVHDFAWTAYPGYQVYEETWRHVQLRLLLRPEHDTETQRRRHFDSAIAALERFDDWVGPYPYTTLTLVDGFGGANGMEYPTLITCGTVYMMPEWVRFLELVTIHEFGHQYFYGMLASNEFEEAWLDEGVTSYLETRIMDEVYGGAVTLPGFTLTDTAMQRLGYTRSDPSRGALVTNSWEYRFGDYGKASYAKPATVLNTLEGVLGWDTMKAFLREYYREWAFGHPTTRDLQATLERVSGRDLGDFFDQFVYGTAVLDYRIDSISSGRDSTRPDSVEARFNHSIRVQRVHDGHIPTTVRMIFEDGSTHDASWDGTESWRQFTHYGPSRLVQAVIDPEGLIHLDIDRLNNYRALLTSQPGDREGRKITVRFQQLALLIASFF